MLWSRVGNGNARSVKDSFMLNKIGRRDTPRGCVYCGNSGHKATQFDTVAELSERKRILSSKGVCFNCAVKAHRAAECSSKTALGHCNKRHHPSIYDKKNVKNDENSSKEKLMTDGVSGESVFPVVVLHVDESGML